MRRNGILAPARRAVAALFGSALLLAAQPLRAADPELLPVGSAAPLFESVDIEGKAFHLAETLKSKPVLLVFWSVFCGTCRDELPILEHEKPKYQDRIEIVTVNLDEAPRAKTVRGFAQQQGFSLRMLLNKTETREFGIDQAYKVKATPALYLVKRDGTVAYGHYGPLNAEDLAEVMKLVD